MNGPLLHSECSNETGNCGCMHAEERLCLFVAELGVIPHDNLVIVTNWSPCTRCANLCLTYGFRRFAFHFLTPHDTRGRDRILENHGHITSL